MPTYPRFTQPIIAHPSTGLNWYLELSNAGILRAGGTTTDPATPTSRLRLVDPTGRAAYQIGLNSDSTPTVIASPLHDPKLGNYQDLSVYSVNGREWNLRVTSGGSLTIQAIDSDWPMLEPPQGVEGYGIPSSLNGVFDGAMWQLTVRDSGVTDTTGPNFLPVQQGERISIRADDDSCSWQLAYRTDGVLFTVGPNDVNLARYHEVLLVSPNGLRFPMSVDANGVLFVDPGMQDIDSQNQWPLVMQARSNILYVVDNRFRPPTPGGRGRGYGRRRS